MRKWLIAVMVVIALYLDSTFFNIVNLYGIRPDVTVALVVSLGVLIGGAPSAAIGFGVGFIIDLFFNKVVGLSSIAYISAAAVAGIFFKKFYADNLIIPTVIAAVASFVKEHIFLVAVLLMGARPNYPLMLAAYILPSALLTGGVCAIVHLFQRKALYRPLWRQGAIDIEKGEK